MLNYRVKGENEISFKALTRLIYDKIKEKNLEIKNFKFICSLSNEI